MPTLGEPSALPTPTLRWMGRRTRVPRCWLSNHSYLSREITVPRFALNPLEVGTGQSENPLRWTGSKGSDLPEACLQPVPSDPEVWVLGEEKQAPILLKIPNTHSPGTTHLMVGSPQEGGAAVLELRELPNIVHTSGSRYFCKYIQVWGRTDEGLRGSQAEPWASQRRTSLGLFACLHPWLKLLIQGVIQVLFIQLNRKKSGAKNNNHTLVPEISKILKA